eukprot:gene28283-31485_t
MQVAVAGVGPVRKPILKQLYVQVLLAIFLGAIFGWLLPDANHANPWIKS